MRERESVCVCGRERERVCVCVIERERDRDVIFESALVKWGQAINGTKGQPT